jgi:hypothetical protein
MPIQLNIDLTRLLSDEGRLEALIVDVGRFMAKFLEIRHQYIELFTVPDLRTRQYRIVNGSSLSELIEEESPGTITSALERDQVLFEIQFVLEFAREYIDSLSVLNTLARLRCGTFDTIDLSLHMNRESMENHGFFVQHNVHNVVCIGGFVRSLHEATEECVLRWLHSCDNLVGTVFGLNDHGYQTRPHSSVGEHEIHELCALICRTISMNNQQSEWSCLTVASLETLLRCDVCNSNMIEIVKSAAEVDKERLEALLALCDASTESEMKDVFDTHLPALSDAVAAPPVVLQTTPGFDPGTFQIRRLSSALRSAANNVSLLSLHLLQWRRDVGIDVVYTVVNAALNTLSIKLLQVPESGFFPTLRSVSGRLPPPTWTSIGNDEAPAPAPMDVMIAGGSGVATSLLGVFDPRAERRLRLVSLVWEIFAHPELGRVYFSEGRLLSSIVQQTTAIEVERACFGVQTLKDWKLQFVVGKDLSKAKATLRDYRGSDVENDIRRAMCTLSNWPIEEVMAICCRDTALFGACYYRLNDATRDAMQRPFHICNTNVVRQALVVSNKIVYDARASMGFDMRGVPTTIGDRLRVIPSIRNWDGGDDSLILSHELVAEGGSDSVTLLREMSQERRVVVKRRQKTRMVFEFCGPLLRELLGHA